MATTRATLYPDSPAGWPQPQRRSSTSAGSSAGTWSRTARTTPADRSSGRQSTRDPLLARPIGVRDAATITASGMARSPQRLGCFPPVYIRLPSGSERQAGHPASTGGLNARNRGEPLVVDESGYQPIEN